MCGIAGLFNCEMKVDPVHLTAMRDIVAHRGPDGSGSVFFENISHPKIQREGIAFGGLAHRRLAIVDLSQNAHQPMTTADGQYWITYNGEIYNHIELRSLLKKQGYCFVSESDTEVILYAYQEWGIHCLEKLRGMFAFAIVDLKRADLFLARDRFGIKPLYYWLSPTGSFAFASEIKQFTVLPEWKAVLNHSRAIDYLHSGVTDHTSETMFQGVYQLMGGHYVQVPLNQLKDIRPTQWFHLQEQNFSGSYASALEQFSHLFEDSVKMHLRADVDVGSCLSGGLDSSSIVCQMNKLLYEDKYPYRQKTFSACSTIREFDERSYIDEVVKHVDVEAHYIYPDAEGLIESLPHIIWHQDEPFGSTSVFAQWCVFQKAHQQGIKVMLDGQGADEYLLGYHGFFNTHQLEVFQNRWFRDWILDRRAMRKNGYPVIPMSILLKSNVPAYIKNIFKSILGRPFKSDCQEVPNIKALSKELLLKTSLPMLLRYEDRNSMAHHVEARVPFVDHPLVNFGYNLPIAYKLHRAITKRPLRTDLLPKAIQNRRDKLGFATPESYWFCQQFPDFFMEQVQNAYNRAEGVISLEYLLQAKKILKGEQPFSFLPWRMINFGQWLETFHVSLTRSEEGYRTTTNA